MFSRLMLFSLDQMRIGGLRYPAPLLNARALEDIWLLAEGAPARTGRAPGHRGMFRRWHRMVTEPVAASDAIYSP
jgi:hypothetical protein